MRTSFFIFPSVISSIKNLSPSAIHPSPRGGVSACSFTCTNTHNQSSVAALEGCNPPLCCCPLSQKVQVPCHGRVLQALGPRLAWSHCFQDKYIAMKSPLPRLLAFSWPPTNPFPWLFYCIRQALSNFLFISSLKLWNVISESAGLSQQQHVTLGALL